MFKWLLPFALGAFAICQAGLNEKLIHKLGIASTVILNSLLVLLTTVVIGMLALIVGFIPKELALHLNYQNLSGWFVIPGILGFLMVAGLPIAFSKLGAGKAIVVVIASQIIFGLVWDYVTEHRVPSGVQVVGACLAMVAAVLTAQE